MFVVRAKRQISATVEAQEGAINDRHSIETASELKAIALRRTTMMAPNEIESHSETTLCKHTVPNGRKNMERIHLRKV